MSTPFRAAVVQDAPQALAGFSRCRIGTMEGG